MSCANCKKDASTKLCGQCGKAIYCSKDCQKVDWGRHKVECPTLVGLDKDENVVTFAKHWLGETSKLPEVANKARRWLETRKESAIFAFEIFDYEIFKLLRTQLKYSSIPQSALPLLISQAEKGSGLHDFYKSQYEILIKKEEPIVKLMLIIRTKDKLLMASSDVQSGIEPK